MTTLPSGKLPSSPVSLTVPAGDGTDLTLHGTLLTPATPGPWPLALLHAGSGLADRNGNSVLAPTPNDSLLQLARALADAGVASVRYDKRGVGESRPDLDPELVTAGQQAQDAAAWLAHLSTDERFTHVVPVGHSAGGLLMLLAAREAARAGVPVPGVVTLAGPGRPLREILEGPLRGVPQFAEVAAPIFDALSAGQRVQDVPEPLVPMLGAAQQPFLISALPLDPMREAGAVGVPVLAVQGDRDFQTTPQDAANLAGAGGHVRTVVLPGMNHVLKDVGDDMARNQQSYLDASIPLHPDLAPTVAAFIRPLGPS